MSSASTNERLIHEQIVDQNLNPHHFYNFLCGARENGGDLDSWTADELLAAIAAFRTSVAPEDLQNEQLDLSCEAEPEEKEAAGFYCVAEDEHYRRETFEFESDNQVQLNGFFRTEKINSRIVETSTTTSFIFLKSTVFIIKTEPFNWIVNRLFEDFACLRSALARDFPLVVVR